MFDIARNEKNTRMCCVCRNHFNKNELLRTVRSQTGNISVDFNNKLEGRGVYICKNKLCIETAVKRKSISRGLKCEIPADIYSFLLSSLSEVDGN